MPAKGGRNYVPTGKPRGRRRGSPNKATEERQRRVAATGPTPHEVQITVMRYYINRYAQCRQALETGHASLADGSKVTRTLAEEYLDRAGEAANAAAPYVHPRLSAIALRDLDAMKRAQENAAKTIDLTDEDYDSYTDEQLAELYRQEVAGSKDLSQ